ncbi:hypothetical protein K437DRAFT_292979 [Tilletiaria anomala UBC 951]|uniref:Uncharacterized protein n=1 Tax=Tilletiaria anomala (strain ATCC 24038 / CBS 436.72 / UBC 951) TaxID=1037660 RepID=A0A066WFG8_TILAU|nr:uncharacterized protein K437DRAFT_292979 [Tilletiaria anomala UBC 951]KDN52531.1 hypothetical protein K437DRAFT_292979 [Tilletiaria anomala UBC 951]
MRSKTLTPVPGPSNGSVLPDGATVIKRLHISGLTPSLSQHDIISRFSSFGLQVLNIDTWSHESSSSLQPSSAPSGASTNLDGKPYAFLDVSIPSEDAQATVKLERIKRLLSGTIWKGAKLRIGDARPDFRQRLEAERMAQSADGSADRSKKRKRSKVPGTVGLEAKNKDVPVTSADVENGLWGWKKTPAGHLIRPMHMRPAHGLPPPQPLRSLAIAGSSKPNSKPKTSKGKDKVANATSVAGRPASSGAGKKRSTKRVKIVTIDPTRYPRSHLTGMLLEQDAETVGSAGVPEGGYWVCEATDASGGDEGEGDNAEMEGMDGKVEERQSQARVKWILKDRDGSIVRIEIVDAKSGNRMHRTPRLNGKALVGRVLDGDQEATSSCASSAESTSEDEAAGESTVISSDLDDSQGQNGSVAKRPTAAGIASSIGDAQKNDTWRFKAYDPDAEADFSDGYDEAAAGAVPANAASAASDFDAERCGTLGLLAKMFGQGLNPEEATDVGRATGPFTEDSEDDDEEAPQEKRDGFSSYQATQSTRPQVAGAEAAIAALSANQTQADTAIANSRSRRAALLAAAAQTQTLEGSSSSYEPPSRFVPPAEQYANTVTAPASALQSPSDHSSDSEDSDLSTEEAKHAVIAQKIDGDSVDDKEKRGTCYQLNSLKDMFKPKEAVPVGGQFSIMAGLDLELDDELDFELDAEAEQGVEGSPIELSTMDAAQTRPADSEAGYVQGTTLQPHPFPVFDPSNSRDMIQLLQKTGSFIPFCRTDTEEEIEARWEEHKGRLTQEYKRRHREAVKKKKRRVTGSRAAGSAGQGAMRSATRDGDGDV